MKEKIEIIDLCSPTLDTDDRSITPFFLQQTSTPISVSERYKNFQHRLFILPWFPINTNNNADDLGYPLFVNIPRMQNNDTVFRKSFESVSNFSISVNSNRINASTKWCI